MAKLIVANWKMNGSQTKVRADLARYLASPLTNRANVVLALPNVYLAPAAIMLSQAELALASQDVSQVEGFGAYTGEVSSAMLAEFGVKYAIVGHSERRALLGEDGSILANKIDNLVKQQIIPIYCIGEAKAIRDSGKHLDFLITQLELLGQVKNKLTEVVIAYEPIWSIGSGVTPQLTQISEVANLIQAFVQSYLPCAKILILYGGSVSSSNAAEILSLPQIDGVLVGGASLKVDEFTAICGLG
jgi:triosephosphate isomerase